MIRSQSAGVPVCLTATHFDAIVTGAQRFPSLRQLPLGHGVRNRLPGD